MDKNVVIYNFMDTFFCCEVKNEKYCEEMVTEHMLVYLCSGEMDLIEPNGKQHRLKKGDSFFVMRNHKMRKVKHPSKNGEAFKGLFLFLKTPFLKKMLAEGSYVIDRTLQFKSRSPYVMLPKHPFLSGLFKSLEMYFYAQQYPSEQLMENKLREAVLTMLEVKPEIASLVFDFEEPWKIDLTEFMENNYTSDLDITEFAHYTGRSLSTFKKEFQDTFHDSPGKWIIRRRLTEAKRLIEEDGEKPLEVYLRVGFKNLSHFSTAFKRTYGYPPSMMSNRLSN
ncbi:MAG: helix-turn-helix transcriptional regulator [Bacteroidaceae bacterium]|nr:helix-turn-helix transcriptional regulator [Bacteroidaceae bacterium]